MRLFNFLDSYKILQENVLSTEFTWGFELEGICTSPKGLGFSLPGYHSNATPGGGALTLTNELDELIGSKGRIGSDTSVKADDRGGWPFEYASGIISTFNPENYENVLKILRDDLPRLNIYINDTCGFHTHISYEKIDRKTAAWIMCCISIDEKLKDELSYLRVDDSEVAFFSYYSDNRFYELYKKALQLKKYNVVNEIFNAKHVDDDTFFEELLKDKETLDKIIVISINKRIIDGDYSKNEKLNTIKSVVNQIATEEKYRNVRIHPKGTLEWRGPRNFLQDEKLIRGYANKLYKIIIQIGKIASSQTWKGDGITIDRSDIDKNVNFHLTFDSKSEQRLKNKNTSLEKLIRDKPIMLATLRPSQIEPLLISNSFVEDVISDMTSEDAIKIWNKLNDSTRLRYLELIKSASDYSLQQYMKKIKDENYVLPDNYLRLFMNWNAFQYLFGDHIKGVPLTLLKDFKQFTDQKGVLQYIKNHGDEIPMEGWKYLLDPEMWRILPFLNMPVKIQKKFVKKNPYNIQYIKNPDESVINSLKEKIPDIEQYVARYYK